MEKQCNTCKEVKELKAFYKDAKGKFGVKGRCKVCLKAYDKQYHLDNSEKRCANTMRWYNANKEYYSEYKKSYGKKNKAYLNFKTNEYKTRKLKATPKWLTEEHLKEIKELYKEAQELRWLNEESFHVDHIIPLRGDTVSGLHVPWNLQILTATKNISKGNRL